MHVNQKLFNGCLLSLLQTSGTSLSSSHHGFIFPFHSFLHPSIVFFEYVIRLFPQQSAESLSINTNTYLNLKLQIPTQ